MKKLQEILQEDVWQHWMRVENFDYLDFRSDIRGPLPEDLTWYLAEIEEKDINQLFIISSSDWADITGGTFRVADVVGRLHLQSSNPDTQRLSEDIQKKMMFLEAGGELDTKLIAVTNCPELKGPFTFIEGNRRSVALSARMDIVGRRIFVGTSPAIKDYGWAKKSFLFKQ
ncbi:MAG: hypothetical protein HY850_10825 [Betaproteobacteria bacterium]|nr:hypothetical protein [Betaproteobacteria bacterium]